MTHNFLSGRTKAIIHYHDQKEYPQPKDFTGRIADTKDLAGHPMLLPILIAEYVMRLSSAQSTKHGSDILEIETRTGQNRHRFGKDASRLTIGYRKTTLDTNTLLTDIGWTTMKLESLSLLYCRVKDFHQSIRKNTQNGARGRMGTDFAALREVIYHQQTVLSNLLISENSNRERSRTQLDAVYNFIAQREASVMTAIGVLTFVFFPGTFVASIFAMPLINWYPQENESRLHNQFWLFPVVTICFTVFVLVVVLTPWLWLSNRITRKPETSSLGLWNKISRIISRDPHRHAGNGGV
ncbi:hypothetical protein F5884DRAFT_809394 [Xylogone sp. PMI_703]|nr:hypothetical protein F5884DRAFT_809394 [Xylogone sp. PMI_703]